MDDSPRLLRNRTVGRNTSASYRDFFNPIRQSPYPLLSTTSSPTKSPPPTRRSAHRPRLSLSPPKRVQRRSSPVHSADRFIPNAALYSQQPSLREILSSPPTKPARDGSQSPTNPQLHSPGKPSEWPNSFDDTIHSYRLATALEIPISPKLLHFHSRPSSPTHKSPPPSAPQTTFLAVDPPELVRRQLRKRPVPPDPFRILDAPELRDDYYAQPLSWSITGTIAVALGVDVFLWDPTLGVNQLPTSTVEEVTSLAFSPTGEILAIANDDGSVLLQSPSDNTARIHISPLVGDAVGALAWRPTPVRLDDVGLKEWLVIGLYDGQVVLVEVGWDLESGEAKVEKRGHWTDVHTDQICGVAWSNDGLAFATGANDNKVCTFEIPVGGTMGLQSTWEKKFEWVHDAAVKALAFKSGKRGVLAAGGGVHDKKIRFYNTFHGTLLSSLDVDAQITTLIWSPSTTEILATFGYTAPGTSTKCAVYAYPSLQCLFAFEIADEIRALYAVLSPSGQDICVAGSDECVRFYRIWGRNEEEEGRERSPIMEVLEGVDGQMVSQTRERGRGRRRRRSGLSVLR